MRDEIHIGARLEPVAAPLELRQLFDVVVQLAVADDRDGAVFVVDRLVATREVDDGQAAHSQRGRVAVIPALTVGTAMRQPAHRLADARRSGRALVADDSRYTTHRLILGGVSWRRCAAAPPGAAP
jgi:hypothetical protein